MQATNTTTESFVVIVYTSLNSVKRLWELRATAWCHVHTHYYLLLECDDCVFKHKEEQPICKYVDVCVQMYHLIITLFSPLKFKGHKDLVYD